MSTAKGFDDIFLACHFFFGTKMSSFTLFDLLFFKGLQKVSVGRSMSIIQDALIFIALVLFVIRWTTKSFFELIDKIPGYGLLDIFKVSRKLYAGGAENFYQSLLEVGKPFETAFKIMLGPIVIVTLRDAEDVKIVLNHKDCFEKHMMYERFFDNGLVVSGGKKQKLRKKMASPMFHAATLKKYLPIMNERMRNFMRRFEQKSHESEFNILHTNFDFTLDVLLWTIFEREDVDDETRYQYVEDVAE